MQQQINYFQLFVVFLSPYYNIALSEDENE